MSSGEGKNKIFGRSRRRRAVDYLIREIKARPILESLARRTVKWWRGKSTVIDGTSFKAINAIGNNLSNPETVPFAAEIKVATILGKYSFDNFAYEFRPVPVVFENWYETFEKEKPDIFFCDFDGVAGPPSALSKEKIYPLVNSKHDHKSILLSIINYCKKNDIPTLILNQENNVQLYDGVHNINLFTLFDYIFTSADECDERYIQDFGCGKVFSLPFAGQPKRFNPIETNEFRSKDIVFSIEGLRICDEVSLEIEKILDKLLENGQSLKIIGNYTENEKELFNLSARFRHHILPVLDCEGVNLIYKNSLFGLVFNEPKNSKAGLSPNIFDLILLNMLVLCNYSAQIDKTIGEYVIYVDRNIDIIGSIKNEEIDIIRDGALTKVLENHTYEKRWEFILESIGFRYKRKDNSVTFVARVSNHDEAVAVSDGFGRLGLSFPDARLMLLLSKSIQDDEVAPYYQKYNRHMRTVVSESFLEKYGRCEVDIIETALVLYVPNGRFPPMSWLTKAKLHLAYANSTYVGFDQSKKSYTVSPVDFGIPLLSSALGFWPLVSRRQSDGWNSVLYV